MRVTLTLLLILFGVVSWSQTSKTVYFDSNWKVVTANQAYTYYRVVKLDNSGTPTGIINTFYKSGDLQWTGYFLSKNIECTTCEECQCHGKCTWYHENGIAESEATYSYGKTIGETKYWDESGKEIDVTAELSKSISSETVFKQLIEHNIKQKGFDPLEGIYNATKDFQVFLNRKPLNNKIKSETIGILKTESGYRVYTIGVGPSNLDIMKTEIDNNYRVLLTEYNNKGNKVQSKGSAKQTDLNAVKIVVEIDREIVREVLNDAYTPSVDMFIEYNLRKQFPLSYDLERIKKEAIEEAPSSGTGFAISGDGLIATNYHVIENAKTIKVRGVNGDFNRTLKAEVVQEDKINDLAILKISDSQFKSFGIIPFRIKNSATDVGENIFVLGYPLTATMGDEVKLTTGIISSKTGFQGNVSQYQVSAPIQPGNSGGPLFDKSGNLIGIINSKHLNTENVGYAVKVNYLQNIIDILPQKITTPNNSSIINKALSEQVKILRNYVYIIEINND